MSSVVTITTAMATTAAASMAMPERDGAGKCSRSWLRVRSRGLGTSRRAMKRISTAAAGRNPAR